MRGHMLIYFLRSTDFRGLVGAYITTVGVSGGNTFLQDLHIGCMVNQSVVVKKKNSMQCFRYRISGEIS